MSLNKLAFGTWLIGGEMSANPDNDDAADIAVIRLAVSEGVTLIDTAQNYADGRCEEIVGEALKGVPRDSYQLLTKQRKDKLGYKDVLRGCKQSMKRLNVDYLDYFVCHAPNPLFDIKEFFDAANHLHKKGKIKNVGVSNFGPKQLKLAVEYSKAPISLNQIPVSVADDDAFSTDTYKFCVENDIPVQAYRVFADSISNPVAVSIIQNVAVLRGLTPHQVIISYLNSYKGMNFTIRASSKEHWDQIKIALETTLNDEDIIQIRSSHRDMQGNYRGFLTI